MKQETATIYCPGDGCAHFDRGCPRAYTESVRRAVGTGSPRLTLLTEARGLPCWTPTDPNSGQLLLESK